MVWTEELNQTARARQRSRKLDIANTLRKARSLAIYINASPQRRDNFLKSQTKQPALVPIQDVRTRWNSTYLMLQRAKRLQSDLDQYCRAFQVDHLMINSEEWRQIDYLLCLTKPFFDFTMIMAKTKDITIYGVFGVYNLLFEHLEASIRQLRRKKVSLLCSLPFPISLTLTFSTLTYITRVKELKIRVMISGKGIYLRLTYLVFLYF